MNEKLAAEERFGWFVRGMMGEFYIWQGQKWYVQGWQQWREWFFGDFNWQNFTLIHIAYENAAYSGSREVMLELLGFCIRIRWTFDEKSEAMQIVQARMKDILVHPECAVELDEILNGKSPRDD